MEGIAVGKRRWILETIDKLFNLSVSLFLLLITLFPKLYGAQFDTVFDFFSYWINEVDLSILSLSFLFLVIIVLIASSLLSFCGVIRNLRVYGRSGDWESFGVFLSLFLGGILNIYIRQGKPPQDLFGPQELFGYGYWVYSISFVLGWAVIVAFFYLSHTDFFALPRKKDQFS